MNNRKVLIAIIIVLIIMIVALALLIIINPFKGDTSKSKEPVSETVPSAPPSEPEENEFDYEGILSDFVAAFASEDDMKAYLEDNLDFKSHYLLLQHGDEIEVIPDEYDKIDEKLYQDKKFVKEVEDSFVLAYVDEENVDLELEIGEVKSMDVVGVDIWTTVQFYLTNSDGDKIDLGAIFCEDKLVFVMDYEFLKALFDGADAEDDLETVASQMTSEEKDAYNATVKKFVGDSKKGSEVKLMIEEIISNNTDNVDELGKFISVHNGSSEDADSEGVTSGTSGIEEYNGGNDGTEEDSLGAVMKLANVYENRDGKNSEENVETANAAMKEFEKSLVSGNSYKVEYKLKAGVIYAVYISPAE